MKRFHVHLAVEKLDSAVAFYSGLFGVPPTVEKPDYAKWMLEDPRVNFAVSSRGRAPGLDHLGIQVENASELKEVYGRMEGAGTLLPQGETTCCYARSEKSWVHDPQGIAWEAFHTVGEATTYGADPQDAQNAGAACCVPLAPAGASKAQTRTVSGLKMVDTAADAACCVPGDAADAKSGCC